MKQIQSTNVTCSNANSIPTQVVLLIVRMTMEMETMRRMSREFHSHNEEDRVRVLAKQKMAQAQKAIDALTKMVEEVQTKYIRWR